MSAQSIAVSLPPTTLLQKLALGAGRLAGWGVQIDTPIPDKCVIIGAHHTSGADFLALLLLAFGGGVRMRWVGKDVFFRPPFGPLLRAIGGVPVDRSQRNQFVGQMVQLFAQLPRFRLAIAPEGTRQYSTYWKTGFYHIARGAQVPILCGYADYAAKVVGIGPELMPTGDIARDFEVIRAFYAGVQGRYPHRHGIVALAPDKEPARV